MRSLKMTTSTPGMNKTIEEQLLESIFGDCGDQLAEATRRKRNVRKAAPKDNDEEEADSSVAPSEVNDEDLKAAGTSREKAEKAAQGMDDKQRGAFMKVVAFLGKMVNSASDSLLASNLEDFSLGNFREAVIEVYKKKRLAKMSDDEL